MPEPRPLDLAPGVGLAVLGGGLGAELRWLLTQALPAAATGGVPWVVVGINVVGSALLAGLGLAAPVRRRPWLAVLVGTGVLGGFTTMSAASADTLALISAGRGAAAAAYGLGTLVPALLAAGLVLRVSGARQRRVEDEGGDL